MHWINQSLSRGSPRPQLNALKLGCGLMGICWLTIGNVFGQPLPSATDVVARMLERSAKVAREEHPSIWAYDRISIKQELDDEGEVLNTTEKIHRVTTLRGIPFSRLVKVRGQLLSESELRKEDKREAEFRKRLSGRDPARVAREKEPVILKDLMERYRFEVRRRENIDGRPTLQLAFSVAAEKLAEKEKTLQDRILNRLAGIVWVDEASSEVARLEVCLTEGFSLGLLGILGSLTECRFTLTRRPMPDGTWLPLFQETHLTARKLTKSMHFEVREESSNFELLPVP